MNLRNSIGRQLFPCWLPIVVFSALLLCGQLVRASVVSVSTSAATGTTDRDDANDFIGTLGGISPTTIGGDTVNFVNIPAGEPFFVGDLVGRDINATAGGRSWAYSLSLPTDAVNGTGFENIFFEGHAFEAANNNLDGTDELIWDLMINGVLVDSFSTGAGVDFNSVDFRLSDVGGAAINDIQVILTVNGFNANNEWFAARGTLSATYTAIPEPSSMLGLFVCVLFASSRGPRKVPAI